MSYKRVNGLFAKAKGSLSDEEDSHSDAESDLTVLDMFGNVTNPKKRQPSKGRTYLFFTLVMILLLSATVWITDKSGFLPSDLDGDSSTPVVDKN